MDAYITSNRELWDKWAEAHVTGSHYDVPGFIAGGNRLHSIELEEVGDVSGKSLLHLQCHFGLDTLSWARLGAVATGADFSPVAIEAARDIAKEYCLPATFVLSNLYNLPDNLCGAFDIVYTSYGTIYWLPDLPLWAEVIAHFLKPGGAFHIVDFHPMGMVFDGTEPGLRLGYPYFHGDEPIIEEVHGSYAEADADVHGREVGWAHTVAAGHHVQYGFETIGPDVWATDAPQMGFAQITAVSTTPAVPEPSSLAFLATSAIGLLSFRRNKKS